MSIKKSTINVKPESKVSNEKPIDKLITLINTANYRIEIFFKDGIATSMSPGQSIKDIKFLNVDFKTLSSRVHWHYQ